jgi:hypothetical protein
MKKRYLYAVRPIYMVILLSLVALLAAGPALAAPSEQGPTDPDELEAFLDELMAEQMEEYNIAGAAVSASKLHQGSQGWMISKP